MSVKKAKAPRATQVTKAMTDKWHCAFHEAAHAVTCDYYGLEWHVMISKAGRLTNRISAWAGSTTHKPTTPCRASVICWAGLVAEEIIIDIPVHCRYEDLKVYEDYSLAQAVWENACGDDFTSVSDTDRKGLFGVTTPNHPDAYLKVLRTCCTASRIVTKRMKQLLELAERIFRDDEAYSKNAASMFCASIEQRQQIIETSKKTFKPPVDRSRT